jgi:hypothetical protein
MDLNMFYASVMNFSFSLYVWDANLEVRYDGFF